jgi:hypothetical protein
MELPDKGDVWFYIRGMLTVVALDIRNMTQR